jgi:hypothetical protein
MEKKLLKVLAVAAVLSAVVSCTKTNHSVYMTVYGTASAVQIKYGQGQSLNDAMNKNVTTLNMPSTALPSLPWTSQTYTVDSSSASVFYLYACNEGTSTPNITIKIFDNGQMVQQSNCSGLNCFCQSVDYVAN